MLISIHLAAGRPYSDEEVVRRVNMMAKKLGLAPVVTNFEQAAGITVRFPHPKMLIEMYQRNYVAEGHNRGGLLENVGKDIRGRTAACTLPLTQFIVGYQGTVIPCCVLVGDDPRHAQHVVGGLDKDTSIFDVYTSRAYVGWRRHLLNLKRKEGPCRTCSAQIGAAEHNDKYFYDHIDKFMGALNQTEEMANLTPCKPAA